MKGNRHRSHHISHFNTLLRSCRSKVLQITVSPSKLTLRNLSSMVFVIRAFPRNLFTFCSRGIEFGSSLLLSFKASITPHIVSNAMVISIFRDFLKAPTSGVLNICLKVYKRKENKVLSEMMLTLDRHKYVNKRINKYLKMNNWSSIQTINMICTRYWKDKRKQKCDRIDNCQLTGSLSDWLIGYVRLNEWACRCKGWTNEWKRVNHQSVCR